MALQGPIENERAVAAGHFASAATGAALFRAADLATAGSDKLTSVPLYLQVARVIEQRIRSGALEVGSLLPVETDLAKMFGVSRQTVRHAIAHLRDRGILSARKGVGTRVESRERDWRSSFSVASVGDLFELARETELHITTRTGHRGARQACRRAWLPARAQMVLFRRATLSRAERNGLLLERGLYRRPFGVDRAKARSLPDGGFCAGSGALGRIHRRDQAGDSARGDRSRARPLHGRRAGRSGA